MEWEEIYSNLCTYDNRNPDFFWDEFVSDEKPVPRKNCFCDNCFHGSDKLALEIIRLKKE